MHIDRPIAVQVRRMNNVFDLEHYSASGGTVSTDDGAASMNAVLQSPGGGRLVFVKIERERIFPSTRRGQIAREVHGICMAKAVGIRVPEYPGL